MSSHRRRERSSRLWQAIEPLEPRWLLAADTCLVAGSPAIDAAATAAAVASFPECVKNFHVSGVSTNAITFSWSAQSDAAQFNIWRRTYISSSGYWGNDRTFAVDGSKSSFTDTAVTTGTSYSYMIEAQNDAGCSSWAGGIEAAAIAAPVNDNFANAQQVSLNTAFGGNTFAATTEPGELQGSEPATDPSVWWKWTASEDGPVSVQRTGYWDCTLSVYTGSSVNALHMVTTNSEDKEDGFAFQAVAGTCYYIALHGSQDLQNTTSITLAKVTQAPSRAWDTYASPDGSSGETVSWDRDGCATSYEIWRSDDSYRQHATPIAQAGNASEFVDTTAQQGKTYYYWVRAANSLGQAPFSAGALGYFPVFYSGNDNLAQAVPLTGWHVFVGGDNSSATAQVNEPLHFGGTDLRRTVWFKWTPSQSGAAHIDTDESVVSSAVYSSNSSNPSFADLTRLDDSAYDVSVQAGRTYWIVVDGDSKWDEARPGPFSLRINIDSSGGADRASDAFSGAANASGGSVKLADYLSATIEEDEPLPQFPGLCGTRWWAWTDEYAGLVRILDNYGWNDKIAPVTVYTGPDLAHLQSVASNLGSGAPADFVSFQATVGTTYYIQFALTTELGSSSWLDWSVEQQTVDGPTGIALSKSSVSENRPAGTVVGMLSATDPDAGDTFTYSLITGNGAFQIVGNQLKTLKALSYAAKSSYAVTVRMTDPGGLSFDKTFTVNVVANRAPTGISLTNASVAENRPAGTVVGTLSAIDPDAGDTATFSLITGKGVFQIVGNQLKTLGPLNYEVKNSYSVTVQATDLGGLSFQKTFTVNVTNVNEAPTSIALSNTAVAENRPAGTVVGTLSATDPDAGDTATYSLITGNGAFQIVGNQLKTLKALSYKLKSSYSVTVQVTDSGGLSYQKTFTVSVIANRAPIGIALTKTTIAQNLPAGTLVGTLSATDPDAGETFAYSLITGNGAFQIVGNQIKTLKALSYRLKSSYLLTVRVTDSGGLTFDKAFTVNVTV